MQTLCFSHKMIDFELTIPKIKGKQFVGFPAVRIDPKKIMEKTSEIQYESQVDCTLENSQLERCKENLCIFCFN